MAACLFMLLFGLILFLGPRLLLIALWFMDWTDGAFDSYIWPILGWIFLPWTTIAYAFTMHNNNGEVSGDFTWLIVIAVLIDLAGGFSTTRTSSD